jgi:hypothetical protein
MGRPFYLFAEHIFVKVDTFSQNCLTPRRRNEEDQNRKTVEVLFQPFLKNSGVSVSIALVLVLVGNKWNLRSITILTAMSEAKGR